MSKYNLDVNNSSSQVANDVKNQLIHDGLNVDEIFEKDIKNLNNGEIYSLFARRYIQPGGRPWSYIEIVENGMNEINDFLQSINQ